MARAMAAERRRVEWLRWCSRVPASTSVASGAVAPTNSSTSGCGAIIVTSCPASPAAAARSARYRSAPPISSVSVK